MTIPLNPLNFRAALGILQYSYVDFATLSGLKRQTLSDFATGKKTNLRGSTIQKITDVLAVKGVELLPYGAQSLEGRVVSLKGRDAFRQIYDDLYEYARAGADICVYCGVSEDFIAGLGGDFIAMHAARMAAITDRFRSRTIVRHGDAVFFGRQYSSYKWMPDRHFGKNTPMIIYGDKVADVDFGDDLTIQLTHNKKIAERARFFFDSVWENIAEDIPHGNSAA